MTKFIIGDEVIISPYYNNSKLHGKLAKIINIKNNFIYKIQVNHVIIEINEKDIYLNNGIL